MYALLGGFLRNLTELHRFGLPDGFQIRKMGLFDDFLKLREHQKLQGPGGVSMEIANRPAGQPAFLQRDPATCVVISA